MNAHRTKPIIHKTTSLVSYPGTDGSPGCGWLLLFIVISYIIFAAINRVLSGYGSRLDQFICFGTLACFVVLWIWESKSKNKVSHKARLERDAETREWVRGCQEAKVNIVDRRYSPGGVNDDGWDIHYYKPSYYLTLELSPAQRAVVPERTLVEVKVYSDIYEKLEKYNTAYIYYKPETPMTFFLLEELYR